MRLNAGLYLLIRISCVVLAVNISDNPPLWPKKIKNKQQYEIYIKWTNMIKLFGVSLRRITCVKNPYTQMGMPHTRSWAALVLWIWFLPTWWNGHVVFHKRTSRLKSIQIIYLNHHVEQAANYLTTENAPRRKMINTLALPDAK